MKTSLVSPIADIASAALSKSMKVKAARVKADQPQQLKSVTVYWRGRKMVLMQRPQRRLSALLCKMLRRSWQNLFGTLVRAVGAGAMATAALTAQAHGGHGGAELPTGYQLIDGQARMWQHRNHMTIKQASESAIFDWQSFSIGAGGSVRFIQNDANAVALNRVLGNDPSVIMGSLTANGKIFLINAAGILVGKTGKIDVAAFTASTLNISNADFNAGKLNFAADSGKTIGDVQNIGMIKTKEGGSVYLIGANVENDGIITAPNGQVLLAAGSMVKLVDTSLPGVSIEVSGVDGKVTNLGQIIASAGTIGIGAALIDNSGIINASSVEREGGRIFLRASTHLTTGDGSEIEANGTTGGNIQLYSDGITNIRGNVSALGSAGNGGYVDTSGKAGLSVHYVPKIGAGGEWVIDPFDIDIVDGLDQGILGIPLIDDVIALVSGHTQVNDGTINAQLSDGVNVTLATGIGPGLNGGRITLDSGAEILKNGGGAATLTLNATTDIYLNGTISDGSTSGSNGGLTLSLTAGGNINAAQNLTLGGGLQSHAAGTLTLSGGAVNVYGTSILNGGTVNIDTAGASFNNVFTDAAMINVNNGATFNDVVVNNSTINVNSTTSMHSLNLTQSASKVNLNNANANLTTAQLNLAAGVIKSIDTNTFTVTNSFTQTGGSMDVKTAVITQATGDLHIGSGGIKADDLTLNATNGAIAQAGAITGGGKLDANATQGINFTNALNNVANFSASNSLSGQIALSTTGSLTLGAVTNSAPGVSSGDITISGVVGTLDVKGAVSAVNSISLTTTGDVSESAGSITADSLSVNATTGINLNGTNNKINNFAAQNTVSGQILLANSKATELTLGTISNINRSIVLSSQGKVTGSAAITAGSLDVVAPGDIKIDSIDNAISAFTASSTGGNITLSTGSGAVTLGAVTASNGNISITDTDNNIAINGPISTGGTNHNVSLAAGAGILQQSHSAGITTDQLSVTAAIDIDLGDGTNNNANHIGSFTGTSESGHIYLGNTGNLTTFNRISAANEVKLYTEGSMTVAGTGITAPTINLTTASPNPDVPINTDIAINGQLSGSDVITLRSGTGKITQTAGIVTASLNAMAATEIMLNGAGNQIASFMANNSDSGNIALTNGGTSLLTLGAIHNGSSVGNITVRNSDGGINTTGEIDAGGTVDLTAAGNLTVRANITGLGVNLTTSSSSSGDIILVGQLTGTGTNRSNGTVVLKSDGGIRESKSENGQGQQIQGGITAGLLDVTANNEISLASDSANSVRNFTAVSNYGGIGLTNYGDLTLGDITANAGAAQIETIGGKLTVADGGNGISAQSIALTTSTLFGTFSEGEGEGGDDGNGGNGNTPPPANTDLVIKGHLNATDAAGAGISLNSAGAILQDDGAGAGINTAALLDANAAGGITLNSVGNNISNFTATNYGVGDIALTTASTTLTLSGNIDNSAENGNVSITNKGVNNTGGDIIGQATFDHETNKSTGTNANGKVTYTSSFGNVTLSGVSSTDLEVNALQGNVTLARDGVLSVTGTMNVSANTGITITNSGGCGTTHIANFKASNTGSGNITLVNHDVKNGSGDDITINNLISINNNGGDISVDNTGALTTGAGQIKASGNVKIATHSPLTIGAGGVVAGGTMELTAGDNTSALDVLVLNGLVQAGIGAPVFGGTHIQENALVVSPLPPVIHSPNPVVQGPDFNYSTTPIVSSNPPSSPPTITPPTTVDQNIVATTNSVNNDVDTSIVPNTNTNTALTKTANDQTVGGTDGEFGGSDTSKDDKKDSSGKPGKPLPICT